MSLHDYSFYKVRKILQPLFLQTFFVALPSSFWEYNHAHAIIQITKVLFIVSFNLSLTFNCCVVSTAVFNFTDLFHQIRNCCCLLLILISKFFISVKFHFRNFGQFFLFHFSHYNHVFLYISEHTEHIYNASFKNFCHITSSVISIVCFHRYSFLIIVYIFLLPVIFYWMLDSIVFLSIKILLSFLKDSCALFWKSVK